MSNQDEFKRRLTKKKDQLRQLQALPDSYTNKEAQIKEIQTEIQLLWRLLTEAPPEPSPAALNKPAPPSVAPPSPPPSPKSRPIYAVGGAILAVVTGLAINLLSTFVQQRFFSGDGFNLPTMAVLAVIALVGALLGIWLSAPVKAPLTDPCLTPNETPAPPAMMTVTRLQLIFSKLNLRGRGSVLLTKVFSFGSKIEIDTRE